MPADPIESAAYGLARGFTQAVLDVIAAKGPELMTGLIGAWRAGWASTAVDAPTDPGVDERLQKDLQNAIDLGEAPPPGAVLHR